ncbi:hypothetical protein ACFT8W_17250 [Streptomyces hygroscopicus]|uniref:hypothetical protein n=1 Tax=Streptomyces hygroscopicus TaxID=1912 RepID=UPI00362A882C
MQWPGFQVLTGSYRKVPKPRHGELPDIAVCRTPARALPSIGEFSCIEGSIRHSRMVSAHFTLGFMEHRDPLLSVQDHYNLTHDWK